MSNPGAFFIKDHNSVPVLVGGISYLFRDQFTDTVAAGEYNNTAATPGVGTRKSNDTGDNLSGNGSVMACAGGISSWGNPRLVWEPTTPLTRASGVALRFVITMGNTDNAYVGWSAHPNASISQVSSFNNLALRFGPSYKLYIYDGTTLTEVGLYATNTEYTMLIVLRATGADFLIKGGAFGSSYYTRLGTAIAGSVTPLYLAAFNYNLQFNMDDLNVIDLTGTAWGDGDGVIHDSEATPEAGAIIDTPRDGLIEFTWTPTAGQTLEMSFRYLSDNERWYVAAAQAANTIKLYWVSGGVATEVATGYTATLTAGVPHTFKIRDQHDNIGVFVDNAAKNPVNTHYYARYLSGARQAKVSLGGSNFVSRPLYVSLIGTPRENNTINRSYAPNPAAALTITTSDGSGEAVHPDIIYVSPAIAGSNYIMVMTPYPGNDATLENPEILINPSGDLETWVVPDGLTNPIEPYPDNGGYFNSDPGLLQLPDGSILCFWRYGKPGENDEIWARTSTDLVTWEDKQQLLVAANSNLVSPTITYDGSLYRLFAVDASGSTPYPVTVRTASAITGPWSDPVETDMASGTGYIWHLDVIQDGTRLYALATVEDGTPSGNYLGYSDDDGLTWILTDYPVIYGVGSAWNESIYRGSIIRSAGGFTCLYSAISIGGTWSIGGTEIVMEFD